MLDFAALGTPEATPGPDVLQLDPVARVDLVLADAAAAPDGPRISSLAQTLRSPDSVASLPDDIRLLKRVLARRIAARQQRWGGICRWPGALDAPDEVLDLPDDAAAVKVALVAEVVAYAVAESCAQRDSTGSLTMRFLRLAEPGKRHYDGATGLYAKVSGTKRRLSFGQRIRVHGKQRDLGLGPYPTVTLDLARHRAGKNRRRVADGLEPLSFRAHGENRTFREVAEELIADLCIGWTAARAEPGFRTLLEPAYAAFGDRPVRAITHNDIVGVVKPFWIREKGKRMLKAINRVFEDADELEYITKNPMRKAKYLLRRVRVTREEKHHRSVPYEDIFDVMQKLKAVRNAEPLRSISDFAAGSALEFAVLSGLRTVEVLTLRWEGIDWEKGLCRVEAMDTKKKRPHVVPMSRQMIECLRRVEAQGLEHAFVFVYRGQNGQVRRLGDGALRKLAYRLELEGSPHGFRSTVATWAKEIGGYDETTIKRLLAHAYNTTFERYVRSPQIGPRRQLMEQWGDWTDTDPKKEARDSQADPSLAPHRPATEHATCPAVPVKPS